MARNWSQHGFRATWVTFFLCILRFQSCREELGSGGGRERRLGIREGEGGPKLPRTHLLAVHVQQDHVPYIVSCDHHSACGRHIQAAKPEAGGRDCAVRFLGIEARSIYSLLLLQYLTHSRHSINIYWMNVLPWTPSKEYSGLSAVQTEGMSVKRLINVSSYPGSSASTRVPEAAKPLSHKASPWASLAPIALGSHEDSFIAFSLHFLPVGLKKVTNQTGTAQLCSWELARKELLPPSEHLEKKAHTTQKLSYIFGPWLIKGMGSGSASGISIPSLDSSDSRFSHIIKSLLLCLLHPLSISEGFLWKRNLELSLRHHLSWLLMYSSPRGAAQDNGAS